MSVIGATADGPHTSGTTDTANATAATPTTGQRTPGAVRHARVPAATTTVQTTTNTAINARWPSQETPTTGCHSVDHATANIATTPHASRSAGGRAGANAQPAIHTTSTPTTTPASPKTVSAAPVESGAITRG
jgi:hypothetical protein